MRKEGTVGYQEVRSRPTSSRDSHLSGQITPSRDSVHRSGSRTGNGSSVNSLTGVGSSSSEEDPAEMAWELSSGTLRTESASRGKKRTAEDARTFGDGTSAAGHKRAGKKGRTYQPSDWMDEDSTVADEEVGGAGGSLTAAGPDAETTSSQYDESMASSSGDEDQDDVKVPKRGMTVLSASSRALRGLHKAVMQPRSLRDDKLDLGEDVSEREDESMPSFSQRVQRSQRLPKKSAAILRSHLPDLERQIGEEWTDNASGIHWRMDLDDVDTEEETPSGRKRRFTIKRRTKKRLTVKKEWRPKWEMPSDSLHPDKAEMVPHYVPVWLNEREFEAAKANGELGSQISESIVKQEGSQSPASNPTRSRTARPKDLLFHQAANPLPLRSSASNPRLGSPARSPGAYSLPRPMRSRSSTPDPLAAASPLRGGKGGRLSLAGVGGSSNESPMRAYALDAAAKRRREEELMRRLREGRDGPRPVVPQAALSVSAKGPIKAVTFQLPSSSDTLSTSSSLFSANSKRQTGIPVATLDAEIQSDPNNNDLNLKLGSGVAPNRVGAFASGAAGPSAADTAGQVPPSLPTSSTQTPNAFTFGLGDMNASALKVETEKGDVRSSESAAMPATSKGISSGLTFGGSPTSPTQATRNLPAKGTPLLTFSASQGGAAASTARQRSSSTTSATNTASPSENASKPILTSPSNSTSQHPTQSAAQSKPLFTFGGLSTSNSRASGSAILETSKFTLGSSTNSSAASNGFTFGTKQ